MKTPPASAPVFSALIPSAPIPRFSISPVLLISLLLVFTPSAPAFATQPPNLGDFESQLIAYHDSGDYTRDLQLVATQAETYVRKRAASVTRPALVLDIDETSLSNWPKMRANQFAYFPNGLCPEKAEHQPQGPFSPSLIYSTRPGPPA